MASLGRHLLGFAGAAVLMGGTTLSNDHVTWTRGNAIAIGKTRGVTRTFCGNCNTEGKAAGARVEAQETAKHDCPLCAYSPTL
jgi:hypothetical protein